MFPLVLQAAFTPKELKELLTQSDISTCAGPHQLDTSLADKAEMAAVRMKRRLLDIMSTAVSSSEAKSPSAAAAQNPSSAPHNTTPPSEPVLLQGPTIAQPAGFSNASSSTAPAQLPKKIHLQFYRSPVEVMTQPSAEDPKIQQVTGLRVEKTALVGTPAVAQGTGEFEIIPAQLVLVSIGYTGIPLPGVPFDAKRGVIPNQAGRVTSTAVGGVQGSGETLEGLYVVGWLKRGPSGIIGTNLIDAEETVACIIADLPFLEGALQQKTTVFSQEHISENVSVAGTSFSHTVSAQVTKISASERIVDASSPDVSRGGQSARHTAGDQNGNVGREGASHVATLHSLLESRGVQFVSFSDWSKLDEFELQAGKQLGKVRDKVSDASRMVELCLSQR